MTLRTLATLGPALLLAAATFSAQIQTGRIYGIVLDPTKAAVPNATVTTNARRPVIPAPTT